MRKIKKYLKNGLRKDFRAFFHSRARNDLKYGIIKEWLNKNTSKTRRRPSKAELERKEAIQRMLISLALAVCLIFGSSQMGSCRNHCL